MFLRSVSQAARTAAVRSNAVPMARFAAPAQVLQTRASSQHAIANPTLAGIEKRWESMPPQEQAELWMQLRDRMKVDWHEMTLQEKKAAYWIAFGPHGPRSEPPKGEGWKVASKVAQLLALSLIIFAGIRAGANPAPRTMTKEWQEAMNEYAKAEKIEAITGPGSEGYTGRGFVQSAPAKSS
ncbi:hypothetical protein VTN49DRAFT_3080 [Thermomyces lanuginosus]|uniref:uncharacterized protein n=1 Tax=Thermomyces lanuginosus TaxID=5541 RepID=UPI003742BD10